MNKKICVIGAGRWGQNHVKTLDKLGYLGGIVESNNSLLKELTHAHKVKGFSKVEEAVKHGFDGYVVASPAETHYPIGKTLLELNQNVLIEKPLTLSSDQSAELVNLADSKKVCLMVGHLLLFHPAIRKIKEVVDSGKIGQLLYLYSTRLNLGTVRTEENVFWSFAPHDISVLDYLIGSPPVKIEAKGSKYLQQDIFDVTITQLTYRDNINAHIFVSWLHPFKEQRLVVVGSKGMLSFDDSSSDKHIQFYNKRIDWEKGKPVKVEEPDQIIPYEKKLPLDEELKYFVDNLGKPSAVASGRTGHEVVKVLEKVQQLIDKK